MTITMNLVCDFPFLSMIWSNIRTVLGHYLNFSIIIDIKTVVVYMVDKMIMRKWILEFEVPIQLSHMGVWRVLCAGRVLSHFTAQGAFSAISQLETAPNLESIILYFPGNICTFFSHGKNNPFF